MKVVGFVGSPRKKGSTAVVVNEVLRGAQNSGAEVKVFHLNDLNIKGCQSCYKCQTKDGRCVQKDDMIALYDEIYGAKAVVIGTPVYMMQVSGQTKLMIDRFYAFMYPVDGPVGNFNNKLGDSKPLVMVYTQAQPQMEVFASYFDLTDAMLSYMGFKITARIVGAGLRNASDAQSNMELMQTAFQAGRGLLNKQKDHFL